MPSKKVFVKEYTIRAHYRTIHTRVFHLICSHCHDAVKRETYANSCPKYGNQCNGVAAKCKRCENKS
ncbi:hypothetical protein [Gloeothece verrucosa]|uniref:Uncharacterized protein n=1 Tax=Gloeothece verrucosa (strain PCC 7822) TaxID=497965 RepID=E0UMF9_GLOV7|nr:hypothetical protein [Gloeothece verrucosa]ADN18139.1 hypothetical protein Cyan7822_6349 [Gloeothece verrucosa PCC 7822]